MHAHHVATALILGGLFALAGQARADSPPYVHVGDVTYNGTGCPDESVGFSLASNYQSFTVAIYGMRAEAGGDSTASARRKFCQLSVEFAIPSGWAFAIDQVEHRGYARLSSGVKGIQRSSWYFQGDPGEEDASAETELWGWFSGNYERTVEPDRVKWSACGEDRLFNVKAELRVQNHNGYGLMNGSSYDDAVRQIYHLRWKRC